MRPELIALCYGSLVQYLADFHYKKDDPMKLRYRWICVWTNRASDWKDHDACGAKSTNAFATPADANRAAQRHRCRGQGQGGPVIQIMDLLARKRKRR